jgi:hypothetical protein
MRIEPLVSLIRVAGRKPAATAASEPLLELPMHARCLTGSGRAAMADQVSYGNAK